jgi:hypothetical protein
LIQHPTLKRKALIQTRSLTIPPGRLTTPPKSSASSAAPATPAAGDEGGGLSGLTLGGPLAATSSLSANAEATPLPDDDDDDDVDGLLGGLDDVSIEKLPSSAQKLATPSTSFLGAPIGGLADGLGGPSTPSQAPTRAAAFALAAPAAAAAPPAPAFGDAGATPAPAFGASSAPAFGASSAGPASS